jgi:hypothetical protein
MSHGTPQSLYKRIVDATPKWVYSVNETTRLYYRRYVHRVKFPLSMDGPNGVRYECSAMVGSMHMNSDETFGGMEIVPVSDVTQTWSVA